VWLIKAVVCLLVADAGNGWPGVYGRLCGWSQCAAVMPISCQFWYCKVFWSRF